MQSDQQEVIMNTHIFDSWHLPHMSQARFDYRDKEDLKSVAKFTGGVLVGTLLFIVVVNAVFDLGMPLLPTIG